MGTDGLKGLWYLVTGTGNACAAQNKFTADDPACIIDVLVAVVEKRGLTLPLGTSKKNQIIPPHLNEFYGICNAYPSTLMCWDRFRPRAALHLLPHAALL